MAGLKRFKYTDKDHAAIVDDCISRIKQTYGTKYWNDFEEDNAGRMLLEAFAYVADLLLFYLDRQANESYIATATERQNLINLCKLIAYTPKTSTAAQVDIKISIDEINNTNVTLPAGAQLQTSDGLIFETTDDAIIQAGELDTHVTAVEGETFEEVIGVSDGSAYQNFYLPRSGVIGIQEIIIAEHVWTYVDSFADQLPEAEVFTAEIDAWRRCEIFFGNGKTGKIPESGENITVKYRIGGGLAGNVAPNTITNIRDIATDATGRKVQISVTNEDWARGGQEPESIDSIRVNAPRFFETQNRCVTQQDYEVFAASFDGIAKARAIVRKRSGEANFIRLYVLTYGDTAGSVAHANTTLKESLLAFIDKYKMLTDWIEIEDGSWTPVDFSGTVIISDGFIPKNILAEINSALSSLLDINTRDMGEALRISDVYAVIDNIEGVLFVELDTPKQTITPENNELLVLGNLDFNIYLRGSVDHGKNF